MLKWRVGVAVDTGNHDRLAADWNTKKGVGERVAGAQATRGGNKKGIVPSPRCITVDWLDLLRRSNDRQFTGLMKTGQPKGKMDGTRRRSNLEARRRGKRRPENCK